MSAAPAPAASRVAYPLWLIVIAGCLIAAINFGPRSSMGFFQIPLVTERGWGRETYSLAMAIQNLMWGFGAVLFGGVADRYGTARVLTGGALLYAAGLVVMAYAPTPALLHVGGGILVGLGVAACSFGIVMAALGRSVTPEKRTLVFGFATAAGSFGQFFFSPLTQGLIQTYGWQESFVILAAIMGLIPILAVPLAGKPAAKAGVLDQSIGEALREAFGYRSYVLLFCGFFVCGFQVAFITVHFPAYIRDLGLDAKWGVIALMLIGLFNVVGSLSSGVLGMRYPKPIILALIYFLRSVAVTVFLLVPASPASVLVFSAVMGILWLSTVPPTNALVATMFGTRYLAMLGGIVFLSHQIGSFLGVWLGGYLYDLNKSYEPVWWLGVALGLFATLVHLPIRETAAPRPSLAPAE